MNTKKPSWLRYVLYVHFARLRLRCLIERFPSATQRHPPAHDVHTMWENVSGWTRCERLPVNQIGLNFLSNPFYEHLQDVRRFWWVQPLGPNESGGSLRNRLTLLPFPGLQWTVDPFLTERYRWHPSPPNPPSSQKANTCVHPEPGM